MSAGFPVSQRDTAYPPRATPWVGHATHARVLKERRIGRARVGGEAICGVPSERIHDIPPEPRVSPFAGMRGSVGAENPWPLCCFAVAKLGGGHSFTGMHGPVGADNLAD